MALWNRVKPWIARHLKATGRVLPWAVWGLMLAAWPPPARAQFNTPRPDGYVTDGAVNALAHTSTTIYLGGGFTHVGQYTGGGAPLDTTTAKLAPPFPQVNGSVLACVADGAGGWYIGGAFSKVGGQAYGNIAHILANGTVDSAFNPNANGQVTALAVSGSTVYAGGAFTHIGGQVRNRIAALTAASGQATAWNPGSNDKVLALAVAGGTVYAGGDFTHIGGQDRFCLASLEAATGNATAWNPNPNSPVYVLAAAGSTIYAGGLFYSMGGQSRHYLAAFDTASGSLSTWNPNPNGSVKALAVTDTTVYVAGNFLVINGKARGSLAAVDRVTGIASAWNPNPFAGTRTIITALAVAGSTVYVAGDFSKIGGQSRDKLAALDANSNNATAWTPPTSNGAINALALSGSSLYVGGDFSSLNLLPRNHLAALDAATGVPTDWNPGAGAAVNALAVAGSTLYAGGAFTTINSQSRNCLASFDTATGALTDWIPQISGNHVDLLSVSGSTVYFEGALSTVGGQSRSVLAAVDARSGGVTPWDPAPSGGFSFGISALLATPAVVYAAGDFNSIGGQMRSYVAALDPTSGAATTWNPLVNGPVNALALAGSTLYIGGIFTKVANQPRNRIAALDASSGAVTAWDPEAVLVNSGNTLYVSRLLVAETTVFAAGIFTGIGGQPRNYLAGVDLFTGNATDWDPHFDPFGDYDTISALEITPSAFYVGGGFTGIIGEIRPNFARFDIPPSPVIHLQPIGRTCVDPGTTVTFSINALGLLPLAYQWKKGTTALSDDGRVTGTHTACLTIHDTRYADTGSYACTVSNTAGLATSQPAFLAVNTPLAVVSPYGDPIPMIGTFIYPGGWNILSQMPEAVLTDTAGTTRRVCTGWKAVGSAPASGGGASITFTLDRPTTITWQWKTQYKLAATSVPAAGGTVTLADGVTPASGWYDAGTALSLQPKYNPFYRFVGWWGDVRNANSPLSLKLDKPNTLTALFRDTRNGVAGWGAYR